jgi:hypothetical protein
MSGHFNGLTPAEAERLALLMEEMGEAQQIIGKILRHGYESRHPDGGPTNRLLLEKELGDVTCAINMMCCKDDVNYHSIVAHRHGKEKRVGQYLHHQSV